METFLRGNESLVIQGYTFYEHNRNITQDGAVAVAAYLFDIFVQLYDISFIDKSVEELTLSSIVGTVNAVLGALFAPGRVNLTC